MSSSSPVMGLQRPRVSSHPPYTHSHGPQAVKLAAIAGLHLDPWQAYVLDVALAYDELTHKFLCFETGLIVARQNGKGSVLEARELWGLFAGRERLILHSAHEYKTANEAFLRIKTLVEQTPALMSRVKEIRTANGEQGITLHNGNRLRFVARSKGSGRGFSADVTILDEAYALNAEQMAALMPTLSSRPNPQIWYASSAGMVDSETLTAVRKRGVADERDPALAYLEWSCARGSDPTDPERWAEANPALGRRIPLEFIQREQRSLPTEEFARERLSIWSDERTEAVIPLEKWEALKAPAGGTAAAYPLALAVDVPPDRSCASIALAGLPAAPDGTVVEDTRQHLELIDRRDGTSWVADALADLQRRRAPVRIMLDPGSPAGALLPALEQAGVQVTLMTTRQLGQACGALYDAVLEGAIRHTDQAELTAALTVAKQRPLGDAWAWSRKDLTVDISPLIALTNAKLGLDLHLAAAGDPLSLLF